MPKTPGDIKYAQKVLETRKYFWKLASKMPLHSSNGNAFKQKNHQIKQNWVFKVQCNVFFKNNDMR